MSRAYMGSLSVFCVFVLAAVGCRQATPVSESTVPPQSEVPVQSKAPPSTPYPQVHGSFDIAEAGYVGGWAAFEGKSTPATVLFYVNGPHDSGAIFLGSVVANLPRPDVNSATGIEGPHGFRYLVPPRAKKESIDVNLYDGGLHNINVFVLDEISGKMVLLSGSPRVFRVARQDLPGASQR